MNDFFNAQVINVQIGCIHDVETNGFTWQTAIYKEAVLGPVNVLKGGLEGDQHTGAAPDPDRAICVHPWGHYKFWQSYYSKPFPLGIFGENLTVQGIYDEEVCIGDIIQCGTALFQVTQPRTPCYKQALRVDEPDFVKRIEQTGRRGFLMRVLEPGVLQSGQPFTLIARPHPDAPLTLINRKFFDRKDVEAARIISNLTEIGEEYRQHFLRIINGEKATS